MRSGMATKSWQLSDHNKANRRACCSQLTNITDNYGRPGASCLTNAIPSISKRIPAACIDLHALGAFGAP